MVILEIVQICIRRDNGIFNNTINIFINSWINILFSSIYSNNFYNSKNISIWRSNGWMAINGMYNSIC